MLLPISLDSVDVTEYHYNKIKAHQDGKGKLMSVHNCHPIIETGSSKR